MIKILDMQKIAADEVLARDDPDEYGRGSGDGDYR